jgi:hypothetical protein
LFEILTRKGKNPEFIQNIFVRFQDNRGLGRNSGGDSVRMRRPESHKTGFFLRKISSGSVLRGGGELIILNLRGRNEIGNPASKSER